MTLPLSGPVSVTVNLSNPGITRQGFGKGLILSNTGNAWATPELTRTYTQDSFSDDFPSGTVENAMLTAFFSQPSPPDTVLVGKGTHKPTMVKELTVDSAVEDAEYIVNVYTDGTLWSGSYTAGGGDTTSDIATGIVAQISPDAWVAGQAYGLGDRVSHDTNKIYEATQAGTSDLYGSGPTGTGQAITDGTVKWKYIATSLFTASAAGPIITATGDAAGDWFALEPLATGDQAAVSNVMTLEDTTADPGVATDLDTILGADATWYALMLAFKSAAILDTPSTGVSAWCNANDRLLVASVSDTECATVAFSSGTDVLHTLAGQGGTYTAPQWHPRDYEFLDVCTAGYFLALDPGSDNWRYKGLVGPTPVNFTPTQAGVDGSSNLDLRRAGYFSTLGGQNILAGGGYVENTTYGFIDTRRNIDWYKVNLQADLIDLLIKNNKLPNTTAGRRIIANAIANRNALGIQKGVISPDPLDPTNPITPIMEPFTVTVPPVTDTDSFNAATRALTGVSTRWKLASPINSIAVVVNIIQ